MEVPNLRAEVCAPHCTGAWDREKSKKKSKKEAYTLLRGMQDRKAFPSSSSRPCLVSLETFHSVRGKKALSDRTHQQETNQVEPHLAPEVLTVCLTNELRKEKIVNKYIKITKKSITKLFQKRHPTLPCDDVTMHNE